jgi:glucan 1,3-beta-glucosidase
MSQHAQRGLRVAIILLLAVIISLLIWLWSLSAPHAVVDTGAARIDCLSYAPFRRPGTSPFVSNAYVSPKDIRADLLALKPYTDCVRTYSVDQGLDAVPAIAASLDMRVMLGVWINRDPAHNQKEIQHALSIVGETPKAIVAIVVGNEVLLRREQTSTTLAGLIQQVRSATDIPVTYADVWEFWLQNRQLASAVDFVTVHILPYWEDEPVAVANAVAHVLVTFTQMTAEFPGHRLMIGETGWPSAGRMRGPARPGSVEQARFVREWVREASVAGIDYNLIEAFDQPWKRQLEGAMGGHWGILDHNAEPKFAWQGPVVEQPGILRQAIIAAVLCLPLFVSVAWSIGRRLTGRRPARRILLLAGLLGLLSGLLLPYQWLYLVTWNRGVLEWGAGALYAISGLLGAVLMATVLDMSQALPGVSAGAASTGDAAHRRLHKLVQGWAWLRLAWIFGCALFVLLHVFDPRYRGYPIILYVLPTLALLLPHLYGLGVPRDAVQERLLALCVIAGLPIVLLGELPGNTQALGFALLVAVMGLLVVWPNDASPSKPSRVPKAPGSTA